MCIKRPVSRHRRSVIAMAALVLAIGDHVVAQGSDNSIVPGSRVFVAAAPGFQQYLVAAIVQKQAPLLVVTNRAAADFEITGSTERGGEATIAVTRISTGIVAFAHAVTLEPSNAGRQAAAESCIQALKAKIEADVAVLNRKAIPPADLVPQAPVPATDILRTLVVRLQGDLSNNALQELRTAFDAQGLRIAIAPPSAEFDFNIVIAQHRGGSNGPAASAIALDKAGTALTSETRSGFRQSGTLSGCLKEFAKKVAELTGVR
jgi:hypothetical protein